MARDSAQAVTGEEEELAAKRQHWLAEKPDWDREFVALYNWARRTTNARSLQELLMRLQIVDLSR